MAATALKSAKLFIVDVDASFLKRHPELSKAARSLYGTMRGLADGKTGELAINGHPLDRGYIWRQAEIGRCSWLKYFRELSVAGLVRTERERVMRVIDGRKRVVLGRAHYFVLRQAISPGNGKRQPVGLGSTFSTVEGSDPQIIQKHRVESGQVTQGKEKSVLPSVSGKPRSPVNQKKKPTQDKILSLPDLTRNQNKVKDSTRSVQGKTTPKLRSEFRVDLTLGSVLGVREKFFINNEDLRSMRNAESIWRAEGCPVERRRLIDVLEKIVSESTKSGVGYPSFLLRRKKELQRADFAPRIPEPSSVNVLPDSCPKCGGNGFFQMPGGDSASMCDCPARRKLWGGPEE